MPGGFFATAPDASRFVVLGLFVMVCLGIAAITAALHAALERTHHLAQEVARLRADAASVTADSAMGVGPIRR